MFFVVLDILLCYTTHCGEQTIFVLKRASLSLVHDVQYVQCT